jgi:outer membrane protein assembly factor BamE (lipoprotein component of BamABCDE complex)
VKAILPVLLLALLVGCASVGHKIDPLKVDQIKKGESTAEEVRALIGSPDQMTRNASGQTIWEYHYAHSSVKGQTYIPYYGMFAGGARVQTQLVKITFGPDGKVEDYLISYGATESNMGTSAAPLPDVEQNKRP